MGLRVWLAKFANQIYEIWVLRECFFKAKLDRPLTIALLQSAAWQQGHAHVRATMHMQVCQELFMLFHLCWYYFFPFSVFKPSFYVMSMIKSHLKRITKHSSGFLCWILRVSHMSQLSNVFRSSFLRTPRLLEKRPTKRQTPSGAKSHAATTSWLNAERIVNTNNKSWSHVYINIYIITVYYI